MTENYITIENVSNQDIELILMNLANLYSDSGYTQGIQLYRKQNNDDSFLIRFSKSPDFERFNYFVNYLRYPEGFESFKSSVRGYFQTKDIKTNEEFLVGDWVMVYVSTHDKEYDNVNIVNANHENYLYDFGGRVKKLNIIEEQFNLKIFDLKDYNHIIDIYPSKAFENSTKPWWKFW